MAGSITFTGMSSSQDMNAVIEAMVAARRAAALQPIEIWKTRWETKLEYVSIIDSALSAFYSTVRGMDRISEFMVRSASSSDTDVLTASASSSATPGVHTVVVNQLAQAEKEVHQGIQNDIKYHTGVDDKTASINASGSGKTFKYSYDGSTRTITVNNTDTLVDLRDDINNDVGNPGVTAKIVTAGGKDHLVLVEGTPSGSKYITIDPDSDMTLDGTDSTTDLTASTFVQTVNASGSDKVFQYSYGSSGNINVTVSTGTTLEQLRDLINNDGSNPGVRAWILDDGGTGSGAMHLVLSGEDMGSSYSITIGGGTTLDGNNDTEDFKTIGNYTEAASAQNAQIRVDGYPSGSWIERTTNSITDAIEGITLNLVSAGTATVTVGTDKSAIMAKAEDFREAFNNVRSAIIEATSYNADTGESGSLLGNYAVQMVKTILDGLVSNPAPGFRDPDDTYINLLQLGFYTDADEGSETEGLLLLDTDELSSVLDNDPNAVADVFSAYFSGVSGSDSKITFDSLITGTTEPNIYEVEVDLTGANTRGRFRVEGETSWHDWVTLSGSSGDYYLTGASGNPEAGLALHITYASGQASVITSEARVKNGVVQELSRKLEVLLGTDGPLENLNEHYNDIIDNMEDKIEDEEYRLTLYEERIRGKFVRLDVLINRMNQYSDFLTQFIANTAKK
ncbi:MAG: flagellar filament capping protein FliD [Proteobacteria bacterium]|nr:flagellar filament capping protein FliD [Pseudomonadota bacterium]